MDQLEMPRCPSVRCKPYRSRGALDTTEHHQRDSGTTSVDHIEIDLASTLIVVIPDIVTIALIVTTTTAAPKEWPNPEQDPLVFVANPVEAEMPGHWVPLSIIKVILERPSTTTPKPTWPPRPSSTRKPANPLPKPEPPKDPPEETKGESKEATKEATQEESKEKTKEESKEKTKEESKEKTKEEEPAEDPAPEEEPAEEAEEEPEEEEDPPADPPKGPKKRPKKPQDGQHNLNVKKR